MVNNCNDIGSNMLLLLLLCVYISSWLYTRLSECLERYSIYSEMVYKGLFDKKVPHYPYTY